MNNKKIYSIIAVTAVLLTAIGVTFAYFIANFGAESSTNINIESKTTDKLYFVEGQPISIVASQENFGEGMGNLSDYTVTSANLKANTNTNIASENYNVFFVIDYNDFEYTTEDKKTELMMKVTDPNGVEIKKYL